jgi:chemotaxis protein MotB
MARGGTTTQAKRPIIIKKVKKVVHGHHGGAWKVAYADFATAMMAFFMLLWLLTVSDKVTLNGVADYFTPSNATMSNSSGSGQILAGTAMESEGAKSQGSMSPTPMGSASKAPQSPKSEQTDKDENSGSPWQSTMPTQPDAQMLQAEADVRSAIELSAALQSHLDQLVLEQTPDGLRIHLVDKQGRPMFKAATAELTDYAKLLVRKVGETASVLPNRIVVEGHTDAAGNAAFANWDLSSARANSARRILQASGVREDHLAAVTGKAASDPMYPNQPDRLENRRITVLLMREAPVVDPKFGRR